MARKVLIIAYYWPPAGGPGVQRWLKFVKYLREFGIKPVVYIPKNPNYPIVDETLVDEIPEGIKYYENEIKEPYYLAKLLSGKKARRISSGIIETEQSSWLEKTMLWIRGNFFIPDARKYWIEPSIRYLTAVISKEEIETIISTGPPHSMHLIGLGLRERHNIPWIADFRDPWTSIGYHKKLRLSKNSQQKHKELEHRVLNSADKILVTSNTTKKEFQLISKKPIEVITNGYDTDYLGGANLDDKFTISHIGSLLSGRDPQNLWKVLSQLAAENEIFRSSLQLEFIGVVSKEVMNSLYRYELAPYIKLKGYVSHAQALRRQRGSQVLLLVEIDSKETRGIVPGKLFEYMAARRPILALGPSGWDAGKIIEETNTGAVFNYEAKGDLKALILKWFKRFQQGNLYMEEADIKQYSRRELTRKLAEHLQWE
ncbi:MAG: glycosyltransferase family 4 protein [Flavobacteriaceae bacterium]